jgi:hypothetical protein
MKVKWCVSPITISADRLPTIYRHCLLSVNLASISSTRQTCRSSRMRTYPLACNSSPHSPTASWVYLPFLRHPRPLAVQNHPRVQPSLCMHQAHSQPYYATRNRARLRTACVMLNVLGRASSGTNLSDSIFGDFLGALQTLARAAHPTWPVPRPHSNCASSLRSV